MLSQVYANGLEHRLPRQKVLPTGGKRAETNSLIRSTCCPSNPSPRTGCCSLMTGLAVAARANAAVLLNLAKLFCWEVEASRARNRECELEMFQWDECSLLACSPHSSSHVDLQIDVAQASLLLAETWIGFDRWFCFRCEYPNSGQVSEIRKGIFEIDPVFSGNGFLGIKGLWKEGKMILDSST